MILHAKSDDTILFLSFVILIVSSETIYETYIIKHGSV